MQPESSSAARGARVRRVLDAVTAQLAFDSRRSAVRGTAWILLGGALLALLLGQDANWDLRNYHLYNAYALLGDRMALDLAPAQMQSYFLPLLDVPYYLATQALPAPFAGVMLGMLHASVLLPLLLIARRVLGDGAQRGRLVPLLALAGLASPAFLSEFGTTMGDASSAPFVLGAFALVLPDAAGRWRWRSLVAAGALLGMAVAFKPTNAIYAVALGLSMLVAPLQWRWRLGAAAVVTVVALLVFATLAGPLLLRVYEVHGNPLFPQFNHWFGSPLAPPVAVADQRWLPQGWVEAALRPFLFTVNPYLISEIALPQLVWPALMLAAIAALGAGLVRRARSTSAAVTATRAGGSFRMLAVFFVVGYLLWLGMFSIHRYLVVLELLAPMLVWWLVHRTFTGRAAPRVATAVICACVGVALLGWNGWGHASWTRDAFRVQAPAIAAPASATVLVVGGEPQGWRVPFLPPAAAYVGVGTNFPESPAYAEEVLRRIQLRGSDAVYAMLPAAHDRKRDSIERRNRWAGTLGLDRGGCPVLRRLAENSSGLRLIEPDATPHGRCLLAGAAGRVLDEAAADAALREEGAGTLLRYGLVLDADSCSRLDSFIGADPHPYQWCRVRLAG